MNLLFVIGSLSRTSSNLMLAKYVEEYIGSRASVKYLDYLDVPMMNTDIEFPTPDVITKLREEFLAADGVWIFAPEYNYNLPGCLKNMLDWVSRPTAPGASRTTAVSSGIKVTYSSVSGSLGGKNILEKMNELLKKMHMDQMTDGVTGFCSPIAENGVISLTVEQEIAIKKQADQFLDFCK